MKKKETTQTISKLFSNVHAKDAHASPSAPEASPNLSEKITPNTFLKSIEPNLFRRIRNQPYSR